ncbi:Conserved domain protein [Sphingobium indicum BiD32]|uniref:Conserved domain protein n=1 Tax=Sphingobium indicum BiD32 TaxID=1301087 RepID=N1MR88_9SPHN|nr:DNA-binding domain-containing protein [Sphingobium indicum]CCW19234.1 Conserved domain protein [Sphingobium indicum BiD32]
MTQLLRAQSEFLACLLDDSAPLPSGWDARRAAGMAVYRNAYRTRLIDVLRDTFGRTAQLVGEDAFSQAAAHHLITHPPSRWTVDLAGEGFAETCTELFANDPDVGEVAWLEWEMHCAFTAADGEPLTLADFAAATADFEAAQWDELRFELMPGTALRPITYDLVALWEALADPLLASVAEKLRKPTWAIVWREGEQPVFGLLPEAEGLALAEVQQGGRFGGMCATLMDRLKAADAAAKAGAMLLHWLELGLVRRINWSQACIQ